MLDVVYVSPGSYKVPVPAELVFHPRKMCPSHVGSLVLRVNVADPVVRVVRQRVCYHRIGYGDRVSVILTIPVVCRRFESDGTCSGKLHSTGCVTLTGDLCTVGTCADGP